MRTSDLDLIAREIAKPIDALGLLTRALRHRASAESAGVVLDEMELGLMQVRRQIASLLDLVRAGHCLANARHVAFPLTPVFERLVLQTARLAHENRVRLSIVPSSAVVVSDPTAVEVILRNLAVNAVFFARGGRTLIGCRRRGGALQVQVWDDGPGIPPQDQEIVFEPLRKLNASGDDLLQGLGLGLTIARDLAGALGHGLELRSGPAGGTVFSLTLPVAPGDGADRQAPCMTSTAPIAP